MRKKTYYLKNNPCYKKSRSIGKPAGIVVHSTGAINNKLSRYVQPDDGQLGKNPYDNDWNQPNTPVCVHAMIGKVKNGDVWAYEILPYTTACWGCGKGSKGSYNYSPVGHIQFEILEGPYDDKEYFNEAYNTAVEYCVWLCKKFGFDENDIVSHHETHELGYGSNHSDADSYFKHFNKTMNDFRKDVKNKLNYSVSSDETKNPDSSSSNLSNEPSSTSSTSKSSLTFMRISTSSANLNCRKTASSSGTIIGQFKKDQEVLYVSKPNSDWIKVTGKSTEGKLISGYCSFDYLKTTISSNNLVKVCTSSANLNCRKTANSSGTVLGKFEKDQELILIQKTNSSWYKVKGLSITGDVITGYCSTQYLK